MKKVVKKSTKQTTKEVANVKASVKSAKKNELTLEEMESRIQELESELGELKRKVEEKKKKALAEKSKKNRAKEVDLERKPKDEKKKAKDITYMDVFRRVAGYMADNGYYLNVGEVDGYDEMERPIEESYADCEESDNVSVKICDEEEDRDGEQYLLWDSVKDFLTATLAKHHANTNSESCASIFEAVACWKAHEYKLVYPCLKWLLERIGKLAEVDVKNHSPKGIMKQLDKLGI